MKTYDYKFFAILSVVLAGIAIFVAIRPPLPTFGSVQVGNQYQSTTTPQVADVTNLCPARSGMASSTTGVLGAVNITASGAGTLVIYDATTTNANLRAAAATTSLIIANFPASPTVGSYHFDVEFKRGLLVDYTTTGTGVSSTTISYRCEG